MKFLDHLEEWLIASLMGAATFIIFVAVVHRYLAGLPIPVVQDFLIQINTCWAQELCIYMFVWMAKFGAAYGVRTGIHVGVDVLINRMNPALARPFRRLRPGAGALFYGHRRYPGRQLRGRSATRTRLRPTWKCRCGWSTPAVPLGSTDVLPLPAGDGAFHQDGCRLKHDHSHVEGLEDELTAEEKGAKA